MTGNKTMYALLLIVALCSIVSIIISIISLSRPSSVPTITLNGVGGGQGAPVVVNGGGGGECTPPTKVYSIAVPYGVGPYAYIDGEDELQGFFKELVTEVCEYANIDCRVVLSVAGNCWKSIPGGHSVGGQGLWDGWFDACMGWQPTPIRLRVFDFSLPIVKPVLAYFFVQHGANFNPFDIRGNKIGFVDSVSSDDKCLARQTNIVGNIIPAKDRIYFSTEEEAGQALENGNVTAVFVVSVLFDHYIAAHGPVFDRIDNPAISCVTHGASLMARKDSDIIPAWNKGFKKMKEAGRFQQLCKEALVKHGHKGKFRPCVD